MNAIHPLIDLLVYQVVLAKAEVSEEALGEEHEATQSLFWILMDFPYAAEA